MWRTDTGEEGSSSETKGTDGKWKQQWVASMVRLTGKEELRRRKRTFWDSKVGKRRNWSGQGGEEEEESNQQHALRFALQSYYIFSNSAKSWCVFFHVNASGYWICCLLALFCGPQGRWDIKSFSNRSWTRQEMADGKEGKKQERKDTRDESKTAAQSTSFRPDTGEGTVKRSLDELEEGIGWTFLQNKWSSGRG